MLDTLPYFIRHISSPDSTKNVSKRRASQRLRFNMLNKLLAMECKQVFNWPSSQQRNLLFG